jgi:hypothetical protein
MVLRFATSADADCPCAQTRHEEAMPRTSPESTQHLQAGRKTMRDLRTTLNTSLANLRTGCPQRIDEVLARIGNRYVETTRALHFERPASELYADPKLEKRVRNYAKAQCNLDARGERIDAEPVKRGARTAVEHWVPESKKDQKKAAEDRKTKAEKRKEAAEAKKAAGGGKKGGGGGGGKRGGGKKAAATPAAPAPASHRGPLSHRAGPGSVPHAQIREELRAAGDGGEDLIVVWDKLHPEIIQHAKQKGMTNYVKALQDWAKTPANMERMMDVLDEHEAAAA